MKVFVVNCDEGRKERLTKASAPLNLELVFVQAPLATDEEVQRRGKRCFERKTAYPTGLAATLGHMRCMQKFLETNDEFCIIIEDDVRFDKRFNEKLEEVVNHIGDADIITLGSCSDTVLIGEIEDLNYGMKLVKNVGIANPWGAQGYVISRKYALFFTILFEEDDLSIPYDYHFVTDCVIFDERHCKRHSLAIPLIIEDPDEQTIAGSTNKWNMLSLVKREDFCF